ncbi:type I methionyl aminopeptidase [Priestia taiwanensis]|uniref:Methionine aminopeptidase n=1 Tax=Priestia taiwanensis TaxID=1347902 RepID=A0A917AMY4_9BACI|nr:type I methionyl aminopeptidase [Priestia taiwanensis]MBM7362477.1 methionyl aminopeptidase [Priestia taiwanensis]GGE62539.1 methionine aminopeptidase 2 [Priestia taiwanensis]
MIIKYDYELEALKKIGRIVALAREEMKKQAKPGMTTKELDLIGKRVLEEHGATSAPEKEYNFPGTTCISVNDEVAHGIPSDRVLQDGDLVNVDVSAALDGYYADTGVSFVIGEGDEVKNRLCEVVQLAFQEALKQARAGKKQNQIGRVVEKTAKENGFTVIKNLTGHGIGKSLHESPDHILNYYEAFDNKLFKNGTVIALEPFVSAGAQFVEEASDGWTFKTPDKSLVAQYEHTIVITKDEPIILTALEEDSLA